MINIDDSDMKDKVLKYIGWAKKKSDWLNPIKQKMMKFLKKSIVKIYMTSTSTIMKMSIGGEYILINDFRRLN